MPVPSKNFIGLWRDGDEMSDSTKWVRNLRASEWGQQQTSFPYFTVMSEKEYQRLVQRMLENTSVPMIFSDIFFS